MRTITGIANTGVMAIPPYRTTVILSVAKDLLSGSIKA